MNEFRKNLEQVWGQLRQQQPQRREALEEVRIDGLRGIHDLRVRMPFPVTVLAGPNGCGKSTVLFALACAYKVPNAGIRDFTPSALFPDFRPKPSEGEDDVRDQLSKVTLEFSYVADNRTQQMRWSRGEGKWNRSFFGRKRGSQPVRDVYIRTLANLSNPSEVRSFLQMAQREFTPSEIDSSQIAFAQRILTFRYGRLRSLDTTSRNLLFAERTPEGDANSAVRYSEFHMSAGERAILWLSINVSKLKGALVLIDEVEAGLHPFVQQMLMLELQRLALRNEIQVVVTTHSHVVLDSVPPEARMFLERQSENVVLRQPHRDLIQKALYGRTQDILSILCEDEEGEAVVRGFLDYLSPKIDLLQNDIEIGRDTGKEEFPNHLRMLAKFRKLDSMLFVLDGDAEEVETRMRASARELGQAAQILRLPGDGSPEKWAWERLNAEVLAYADRLGISQENLRSHCRDIDSMYQAAADRPATIVKNKFGTLCERPARRPEAVIREVARTEARAERGLAHNAVNQLQEAIQQWRSQAG